MTAAPPCTDELLWDVWMSTFHAPALVIADSLGMFSALAAGGRDAASLAPELGVQAHALEALMGLAASLGFLTRKGELFTLTQEARTYLLPSSPYYWGGVLARIRHRPVDCKQLVEVLRQQQATHVTDLWVGPPPPPERLRSFTHAMHAHSFSTAMHIAPDMPLAAGQRVLDAGGGSGAYSIAFALHRRELSYTVMDLPPVCEVAASYIGRHGVDELVGTVPRNMFEESWPKGFDHVWMSDIFHDWNDEQCAHLAKQALGALRPGGRLTLHEMLLDADKTSPLRTTAYSFLMVLVTQGRQRTASELSELLLGAGFVDVQFEPSAGAYSRVSAARPG